MNTVSIAILVTLILTAVIILGCLWSPKKNLSTRSAIMRRSNRAPSGDADFDRAVDKVAETIAGDLGIDPGKIQPGDDLISDLGYATDFIGLREERDDLEEVMVGSGLINSNAFRKCRTVGDIAHQVMSG